MPKVTDIKKQKNSNRVNVYIDEKFSFGTSLETLLKQGIKKDKEIDEGTIRRLKEESNLEKVYGRLLRFSTIRPRSEKEIRLWFRRKNIPQDVEGELFNKLKSLKLVDDEEFAKWWVGQRSQFRPKGKIALIAELKQKGVERDIIEKVLKTAGLEEKELAKGVAVKKLARLEKLPFEKKKEKLLSFLGRRGFSWEVSKKVVDELLKKE